MILRSEKIVFIIKGLILLIGFPNNKYHPNTKNYLTCLLLRGGGLVLGGRDYLFICLFIYILHQPNPWKKRVEVSKPGFELVSEKKTGFTRFLMKQLRHNPSKNRRKPVKTHQHQFKKNSSPKPTKSLVCRGHQTFFVGLECLRSICPQNFWILYRFLNR